MHDTAKICPPSKQAARAVNYAGCMTTEEVADYCGLTSEGAYVVLKQLHREGRISRGVGKLGFWLPRVARPVDDPTVYAPFRERREGNSSLAVIGTQGKAAK